LRDKADEKLFGNIEQEVSKRGLEALHEVINKYFEIWNVAPSYGREQDEGFAEMRAKLNSEAGIIISNHPGYMDVPAILNCIAREDIKIMVDKEGYEILRKLIGDRYIVPADKSVLFEVEAHIKDGGVFLIFPTGETGDRMDFRAGFTKLLESLQPDNMVYSFYINPQDVKTIESAYHGRSAGVASALYLNPAVNINRLREAKAVNVDERYSTAKEWQEVYAGTQKMRAKTALLTQHYKDIYGINAIPTEKGRDIPNK
jgi:hypothetical protein